MSDLFKAFFERNKCSRKLILTNIVLILKSVGATCFGKFKPSSLCNLVYKLISKILANSLWPLFTRLISLYQLAFVLGHPILENAIIVQEIMHGLKYKKEKGGWWG